MIGYSGFQYLDNTPQLEVLFGFLKDYWGHGFATEAANACLRFGFEELRCSKVYAVTHPENRASRCILEKVGMAFDKKSEHYRIDSITYKVSRDEYTPSKDFYKLDYENQHQIDANPKSVHANDNHLFHFSLIKDF